MAAMDAFPEYEAWTLAVPPPHFAAWPARLPSQDDLTAAWAAAVGEQAPPVLQSEAAPPASASPVGPTTPRAASPVGAPVVPTQPADWEAAASLLASAAHSFNEGFAPPPAAPAPEPAAAPAWAAPPDVWGVPAAVVPKEARRASSRGPGTPPASGATTPVPRRPTRARSAAAAAAARAVAARAEEVAKEAAIAAATAAGHAAPAPARPRRVALAAWRAKKARRAAGLAKKPPAILYQKRKDNADRRPRVQGRFLSREAAAAHFASLAAAQGGVVAWA